MTSAAYIGRFAPSPTGFLHFGSLLAAMASYCDARHNNGQWLLRIDDIDPPRAMPGAAQSIIHTLAAYGFNWDCAVIEQSARSADYLKALVQLQQQSLLYLCRCSRRTLAGHTHYPGFCKPDSSAWPYANNEVHDKLLDRSIDKAIRVSIAERVSFTDLIQGEQHFEPARHYGDTVLMRRDGLFAYALCCAVDDANGITHVVRGYDLLPTTGVQIHLMALLGLPAPTYAHIPVALNAAQQKLSKQTHAEPIDTLPPLPTLLRAWQFLGQSPLNVHSIDAFWQAALQAWQLACVPASTGMPINPRART